MNSLDQYITYLESIHNKQLVNIIPDSFSMLQSLRELNKLIELDEVKDMIVRQMKLLLLQLSTGTFTNGQHMLHTIIYGGPGTGKTTIGLILAKLWTSLGLIKRKESAVVKRKEENKIKVERRNEIDRMGDLDDLLAESDDLLGDLRNEIIRIKKTTKIANIETSKILIDKLFNTNKDIKDIIDDEYFPSSKLSKIKDDEEIEDIEEIEDVEEEDDNNRDNSPIRIVSRVDFVGGVLGATAIKTRKLLNESRGKVLFVDEAYSLYNGPEDQYGIEAITELNRFMSENSGETIVILAGYKDWMKRSIFHIQPGFERRCMWMFDIRGYSSDALASIFRGQVEAQNWTIEKNVDLCNFFKKNYSVFPNFGGDTNKFLYYCKLEFASKNKENKKLMIDGRIMSDALELYKKYKNS